MARLTRTGTGGAPGQGRCFVAFLEDAGTYCVRGSRLGLPPDHGTASLVISRTPVAG